MRIMYVTGCLGFIGSKFTQRALAEGWCVYGVDRMTYASNRKALEFFKKYPGFKFIESDINDLKFLHDCDYVINFAAETHVENSINNSDEFINTNIVGVKNLLELIRNKHINCVDRPRFVQISTDEVYGDCTDLPFKETDLLKPSNPYAAAKASADMLVQAWSRTYNIEYNIIRPTNNYGHDQYPEKLIPLTIKNILRGKKIKLHNGGEPVRTWLHVFDTRDAIFTILSKGKANEIYNISSHDEFKNIVVVRRLIDLVNIHLGDNKDISYNDYIDFNYSRDGQDVRYSLDDSKLRSLGWNNKIKMIDELPEIVKNIKEESLFND